MKKIFLLHAGATATVKHVEQTSALGNFSPEFPKVAPNAPPCK